MECKCTSIFSNYQTFPLFFRKKDKIVRRLPPIPRSVDLFFTINNKKGRKGRLRRGRQKNSYWYILPYKFVCVLHRLLPQPPLQSALSKNEMGSRNKCLAYALMKLFRCVPIGILQLFDIFSITLLHESIGINTTA